MTSEQTAQQGFAGQFMQQAAKPVLTLALVGVSYDNKLRLKYLTSSNDLPITTYLNPRGQFLKRDFGNCTLAELRERLSFSEVLNFNPQTVQIT